MALTVVDRECYGSRSATAIWASGAASGVTDVSGVTGPR